MNLIDTLGGKQQVAVLATVLAIACALPFVVSNYTTFQFTLVLVYSIALLGLNILTGYNGQISLGHGAFYAIGAYAAAILMDKYDVPYWATVPVAGFVCLIVGVLENVLGAYVIGNELKLSVALVLIIGVLVVKPSGLFGKVHVTRV